MKHMEDLPDAVLATSKDHSYGPGEFVDYADTIYMGKCKIADYPGQYVLYAKTGPGSELSNRLSEFLEEYKKDPRSSWSEGLLRSLMASIDPSLESIWPWVK